MDAIKALDLLSYDKFNMRGMTYAAFMAKMIGSGTSDSIRARVAGKLNVSENSNPVVAMDWLGLFSDEIIGRDEDSPFELVSDLMINKMMIGHHERDMIVMLHTFLVNYPGGKKEVIKSSMLDFGTPATDTSVARTVALPAACAVDMILQGEISNKGVHIPIIPTIYNPVLDQLETLGIKMVEQYGLPESENIN